jgi:hypothetical protein
LQMMQEMLRFVGKVTPAVQDKATLRFSFAYSNTSAVQNLNPARTRSSERPLHVPEMVSI